MKKNQINEDEKQTYTREQDLKIKSFFPPLLLSQQYDIRTPLN